MENQLKNDDPKLDALAGMVTAKTGLGWGPRGRALLQHVAEGRIQSLALSGLSAYIAHLRRNEGEWQYLIPRLTDDRTSFFRNSAQLDVLRQALLSDLTLRREERRLTLVSAGCGSGAEPFSMAVAVRESGLLNKGWQVSIHALDINPESVDTASLGTYPASDLAHLTPEQLHRWFRRRGNRYQVKEDLREMVDWNVLNLADRESGPWPDLWGGVDAVLIRHVLIGLAPLTGKRISDTLAEMLAPGGILILGPEEGLPFGAERFEAERWGGLIYYRRTVGKQKVNPGHTSRKALKAQPDEDGRDSGILEPFSLSQTIITELQAAAEALNSPLPENAWPLLEKILDSAADQGEICSEALGLAARTHLLLNRWAEARDLLDRVISFAGDRAWSHMLMGEAWSGDGRLVKARSEWEQALKMFRRHPEWKKRSLFSDRSLPDASEPGRLAGIPFGLSRLAVNLRS